MRKTASLVLVAALACGCSLFQKDKKEPPPVDPSFTVTPTQTTVLLPFDGCLAASETVTTPEGVELRIPAGTCLTTVWGERLTGGVIVSVGSPADATELETMAGGAFHGAVEIGVALEVPGGNPMPIEAAFTPPAELDLSAVLDGVEGQWNLHGFGVDRSTYAYPPPSIAARPPGEPPAAKEWVSFDVTNIDDDSTTTTKVPVSSVTGADLSDPTIPADGETVDGPVVFEEPIGSTDGEWPKVASVTVIEADTAIIRSLTSWIPGLYLPGQRRIVDAQGREDAFEIKIVDKDGQRTVQVVTPVLNKLSIRICLRHEDGSITCVRRTSTGYSDTEQDTDGEYIGRIQIHLHGCFDIVEYEDDILPILEANDADFVTSPKGCGPGCPGGSEANGTSGFYSGSVRNYAAALQALAPAGWTITFGNRTLNIEVPWPAAQVVVTDGGAKLLHELDPATYAVTDTIGPITVTPNDLIVGDGVAVVAGNDQIEFIDLVSNSSLGTGAVPGLISAIAPGPFGEVFYLAHAGGELQAISFATTMPVYAVPIPQGHNYTGISISGDGAKAYVTDATQGEVLEIDLLRRTVGPTINAPNVTFASVSHDGRTLAAVDTGAGAVNLFELGTMNPPTNVQTGAGATRALWPRFDDGVIVSNPGAGSVTFVDRTDGSVVQVPTAAGATSIAEANDGASGPVILVGNLNDNSISQLPYTNIGTAPTVTTNGGTNQPNAMHARR